MLDVAVRQIGVGVVSCMIVSRRSTMCPPPPFGFWSAKKSGWDRVIIAPSIRRPRGSSDDKGLLPRLAVGVGAPQAINRCVCSVCVCVCVVCVCVCVCMCVTMKKSARRMASTTSDTGDTSSKQQLAQRKENYNKSKRPVSSVDHCHPHRRKERREAVY